MNANVPWVAIIPGTILILYGIICMVKGKKSFDEVVIGICLGKRIDL